MMKFVRRYRLEIFIFAAVYTYLMTLKIVGHNIKFSDGPIYLYMAKLILEGHLPYRDFFYANPSGHVLSLVPVMALLGSIPKYLNLLPAQIQFINGILFVAILRQLGIDRIISLFAGSCYILSFSVIATSDHLTGIDFSIFLTLLTIFFALRSEIHRASLAAALVMLTRFFSLPWLAALFLFLLPKSARSAFRLAIISFVVFAVGLAGHFLLAPENVATQMFKYHFLKTTGIVKSRIILYFLYHEWFLLVGLLGLPLALRRRQFLFPLALLFSALFLWIFKDIYYFYLTPIVLCLLALWCLLLEKLKPKFSPRFFNGALVSLAVFYIAWSGFFYWNGPRIAESIESWDEIVSFVRNSTSESATIYGAAEITPLIALAANRDIVGRFVDTNVKTSMTGLVDLDQRLTDILSLGVKYVITPALMDQKRNVLGVGQYLPEARLNAACRIVRGFPLTTSSSQNIILIWDCKPSGG